MAFSQSDREDIFLCVNLADYYTLVINYILSKKTQQTKVEDIVGTDNTDNNIPCDETFVVVVELWFVLYSWNIFLSFEFNLNNLTKEL